MYAAIHADPDGLGIRRLVLCDIARQIASLRTHRPYRVGCRHGRLRRLWTTDPIQKPLPRLKTPAAIARDGLPDMVRRRLGAIQPYSRMRLQYGFKLPPQQRLQVVRICLSFIDCLELVRE